MLWPRNGLWSPLVWSPFQSCSTYFIGVYYRSPSSDMAYLTWLVQSLQKFPPSSNILLLGVVNPPNVNWNLVAPWQPDTISDFFCESVINCFGLSRLVNKPTRGDASLDLILTNTPAHLANVEIDCGLISRPHQAPKIVYDYKNTFSQTERLMENS